MRSLVPDRMYFQFLDEMQNAGKLEPVLETSCLVREFPTLHAEEAKAVCADWRRIRREQLEALRYSSANNGVEK